MEKREELVNYLRLTIKEYNTYVELYNSVINEKPNTRNEYIHRKCQIAKFKRKTSRLKASIKTLHREISKLDNISNN